MIKKMKNDECNDNQNDKKMKNDECNDNQNDKK